MAGVERGEIKKLLILESLPKPINYTGGMAPMSCNGTFTMERVLGTVPVEADGSAYMEVPANRALILVALDADNSAVKRMQSFLSVAPGEVRSCIGCHEQRHEAIYLSSRAALLATKRRRASPNPCPGFRTSSTSPATSSRCSTATACAATTPTSLTAVCSSPGTAGRSGHRATTRSRHKQFVDGRNRARSNYAPRTFGDAASPLMKKLDGSHYEVEVTDHERELIRTWINVGAPYPGTYAALGTGMIGGYEHNICQHNDTVYPEVQAMTRALKKALRRMSFDPGERGSPTSHPTKPRTPPGSRSAIPVPAPPPLQPLAAGEVAHPHGAARGERLAGTPARGGNEEDGAYGLRGRVRGQERRGLRGDPAWHREDAVAPERDQALRHAGLPAAPVLHPRDDPIRPARCRLRRDYADNRRL